MIRKYGMTISRLSRVDRPCRGHNTVIGDFIYLVILDQIKLLCHFHIYTISSIFLLRGSKRVLNLTTVFRPPQMQVERGIIAYSLIASLNRIHNLP